VEPVGDPGLWNEDLAPTPASARTWTVWHVASLWVGMAVCIPTYLMAGEMVKAGMSVMQSILTIALGNVIVLVPMVLNAHPGTAYGIPFPVFARASFGVRGANLAAIARALVA
jgi:NCS1 family nucleobase:cation symporter-1